MWGPMSRGGGANRTHGNPWIGQASTVSTVPNQPQTVPETPAGVNKCVEQETERKLATRATEAVSRQGRHRATERVGRGKTPEGATPAQHALLRLGAHAVGAAAGRRGPCPHRPPAVWGRDKPCPSPRCTAIRARPVFFLETAVSFDLGKPGAPPPKWPNAPIQTGSFLATNVSAARFSGLTVGSQQS